jgi:hypothetical protein
MLKERKNRTFEKGKAKMSLCSIKHEAMKTWGSGGIALPFLASVIDGGKWQAARSGALSSEKTHPVPTGQEAGWVPKPFRTLLNKEKFQSWVFV